MASLTGLEVIITRPRAQAEDWQRQLEQLGAATRLIPVLEILPADSPAMEQAIKRIILRLDECQLAIFVSRNAVHMATQWIDDYWPQRPLGIDYYAVGEASAGAAREEAFDVTAAGQAMNSEALLALPGLQTVAGKRVVIFRGQGGRPLLASHLAERGADVWLCELYRRQLPASAAGALQQLDLKAGQTCVISAHSGESLANLLAASSDEQWPLLLATPLLVPGDRVAALARDAGFQQVLVADNATDSAMTKALQRWHSSHH